MKYKNRPSEVQLVQHLYNGKLFIDCHKKNSCLSILSTWILDNKPSDVVKRDANMLKAQVVECYHPYEDQGKWKDLENSCFTYIGYFVQSKSLHYTYEAQTACNDLYTFLCPSVYTLFRYDILLLLGALDWKRVINSKIVLKYILFEAQ